MQATFQPFTFPSHHFDKGGKKNILTSDCFYSKLDVQNGVSHDGGFS